MKYIIEIKPEYEDSFKGLMILGARDSKLFVDVADVANLEVLNSDYINEHYGQLQQDAYDKGYKDGRNVTETQAHNDAYQRGFEDGKAVNERGCEGCKYAGKVVTGPPCITCSNSYKNQWAAKDDKIEVGDEVAGKDGDKTIVTNIHGDLFDGLCSDGSTMTDLFLDDNRKTGRHFNIDKILEEMKA